VALGAAAIAEHVVSDAVFAEETADIFSAISETGGTDEIETANQFLPGLADGLIGVAEFIEAIGGRLIAGKNAFGRMGGTHFLNAKHLCWWGERGKEAGRKVLVFMASRCSGGFVGGAGDATGISFGEEDGRLYANLTIF